MPIQNRNDAVEIEEHVVSIFNATPNGRAAAVRRLIFETLDFKETLNKTGWLWHSMAGTTGAGRSEK